MGRVAIRAAAQAYLTAANIPFVGTVYRARPTLVDESNYENTMLNQATNPNQSSAVLVINLPEDQRERRSFSGRAFVDDSNIHDIVVEVFFASRTGDALAAQDDADTLLDALAIAVRADPTLGNPNIVWSAGEYQKGVHTSVHAAFVGPDGLTNFIIATVRFDAWEWLAGPAGTT
jgi:hypothetical protein